MRLVVQEMQKMMVQGLDSWQRVDEAGAKSRNAIRARLAAKHISLAAGDIFPNLS
jgi:hypothetical protein